MNRVTSAMAVPLLHDHLVRTAARVPDKVGLVIGDHRYTYRQLDEQTDALARALVIRGVGRGDRVIVFADNTLEAVLGFWGVLKAGAVVSIVNPLTKTDKLAWLLADCRARALITSAALTSTFVGAAARSRHLETVLVAGGGAPLGGAVTDELPRAEELHAVIAAHGPGSHDNPHDNQAPLPPLARVNIDVDLAALIYTSGSTGDPKGVMLTHRNMLTASSSINSYLGNTEDDVILDVLPLAFDYGLYQMIMAFQVGATLVLERSFAYPAQVLSQLVRERVTAFPGVPTVFALLAQLKNLATYDFSSVRYVSNTAAALGERQIDDLGRIFPAARIFSMYGLTECKRCTYLPPEDLERKKGSVGIAIPNTELWLVDEADHRLGPGVVGQLVIRGATVMKGYWEKPEATAERLRPGPLPGEQVLYTGDLCRLDEDGYLYFVGRMDDIIKSRGEKVAPKEVEIALGNVPGVREAAVIGVPDEVLGQAIKAFVVLDEGATLDARALIRACQARLESFMVPKEIVIVPSLPRTTTGKIKKTDLR